MTKSLASDNWSGVHPMVMDALINANQNHQSAYGEDDYTNYAQDLFRSIFGAQSSTHFVFTGTAANVLAIESAAHSFNSVICSQHAHIHVDECGALEKHSGIKIIAIPSQNGKIRPKQIMPHIKTERFPHQNEAALISITQSTELGTVYTVSEIKELADLAHKHGLYLHIDGARIANAAASLNIGFKEMLLDTGVDLLSFGGTKSGLMFGEAIVVLNPKLGKHLELYRKQGMQLSSKMRFISAQFIALLSNDLWRTNALHANKMAQYLAQQLQQNTQIKISQKVESNGVWAIIPSSLAAKMQNKVFFYPWDENKSEYRFMCSWDTSKEEIDHLLKDL
ncbi:MAG: threonine aldolase [Bacteroidetes bacterium 4572_77]|nr:MAG: threonine aldolase [Bacteroidetes bacterium 4572_77]